MTKNTCLGLKLGKKTLFVYRPEPMKKGSAAAQFYTGDTTTTTITLTGTIGPRKNAPGTPKNPF
jgi:hypothetical protein